MQYRRWLFGSMGGVICLVASAFVWGQVGGIGGGQVVEGVYVDAGGVLRTVTTTERGRRLDRLRASAELGNGATEVSRKSPLRKVSLARLARRLEPILRGGGSIPDEMRYLAGLQQIQFIFGYPEQNDVVVAGPAEGWLDAPAGRVLGADSGRPVVRLDDLAVALRLFSDPAQLHDVVGCSINHSEEGLRRLREYITSLGTIDRRQVGPWLLDGVRTSMGFQEVVFFGVPADTHLALVLVEADYRMKLIGIGLEPPRVRGLPSYVSLLRPGSGGLHKLQRWWFVPEYEAILQNSDATAFELRGQRVRLLSADDFIKETGEVEPRNTADPINRRFAESFTRQYDKLAAVNPAFAELQNAFDLILLGALLGRGQPAGLPERDRRVYLETYVPENVTTPQLVESVVNYKWLGTKLALPVGGGVVVRPGELAARPGKSEPTTAARPELPELERWWWD